MWEVEPMDPVTLIVTALAAGASAALKDTASQAIKDAYSGLKSLLERKFADESLAQDAIGKYEEAPAVWKKPLEDELTQAGVANDEDVIRAAQRLLAHVDPAGAQSGKYNVEISGGKGIVVGDSANVTMNFNDD
jgi:hypothetical protein